jgi:NADH-quinone oxidoreductase subunit K
MVPVIYYVALSAILFILGTVGVLIRRNAIIIFMSVELMLNAANLAFVAFARHYLAVDGQIFVFFVMAVAASEVALIGLVPLVFRSWSSPAPGNVGQHRLRAADERAAVGTVASLASGLAFVVSVLLAISLNQHHEGWWSPSWTGSRSESSACPGPSGWTPSR